MNHPISKYSIIAALLLSVGLSGCVVETPRHHYVGGVVTIGPPPLRHEVIGVAPVPGDVWIDGYWSWNGNQHEWIGGRWEHPRPGYRWVPHRWHHERDGWHMEEGHWERHGHR